MRIFGLKNVHFGQIYKQSSLLEICNFPPTNFFHQRHRWKWKRSNLCGEGASFAEVVDKLWALGDLAADVRCFHGKQ